MTKRVPFIVAALGTESRCSLHADLAPIIKELQAAGKTSLRAVAEGLNVSEASFSL